MRILILGATGFIGRNMVEHFSKHGHTVHATWHSKAYPEIADVYWIHADLMEPFDFRGYDVVIQAAATTSGSKDIVNNPAIHVTDNAIMNALIFRAATEAKVGHVIFFSCSTMFSNGLVTEESPIDIHPKYFGVAHTKLYNEKMCEFYAGLGGSIKILKPVLGDLKSAGNIDSIIDTSPTKFTVIRHSNIYGPHDKFDLEKSHVFGATMTKVMQCQNAGDKKESITIWGTGEESRDLLHVDDLCNFVQCAIEKQPEKFGLYNCGSGEAISINDLALKIIECGQKDIYIYHDLSAPTIPTSLSLDCTKAKMELEWEPKISLEEGIRKIMEWWHYEFL